MPHWHVDGQPEQPIMTVVSMDETTDVVEKETARPFQFRKWLVKVPQRLAYRQGVFCYVLHITRVSFIGDMNLKQAMHFLARERSSPILIEFYRATLVGFRLISLRHSCE